MNCNKCKISCFDEPLHRVNPKGETPGIFMCKDCHPDMNSIDPVGLKICNIIVGDNND